MKYKALALVNARSCKHMGLPVLVLLTVLGCNLVAAYTNGPFGVYRPYSGGPRYNVSKPTNLGCLHTVAPPPYNYHMRCPDTADITDYFDNRGSWHRRIVHAPLKGVTFPMLDWFLNGIPLLTSPFMKFRGQMVYWYKVWHPVDHISVVPLPLPNPDIPKLPSIFLQVHEAYRALPSEGTSSYELDMPVYLATLRAGVQFRVLGNVLATLVNWEWYHTPQGLKVVQEIIVGTGFPKSWPDPAPRLINKLVVEPLLNRQLRGLIDQLTRHTIEEFGNFEEFLPELYATYHPVQARVAGAVKSQKATSTPISG